LTINPNSDSKSPQPEIRVSVLDSANLPIAHATSGSTRRDALQRHYQISGIELETIVPGRLISIDITLAHAGFVVEINL
jgi:hypothetical protein